jgi:DNA-binding PadR family transcriptional regulator
MSLIGSTKLKILKHPQTGPAHGYEIAKNIGVSSGGIYTHLDDLREEGMITVAKRENEGR